MTTIDFLNETAWACAPYLRLRPTQLFPITMESAPFISSVWLVLASICYFAFVREGPNAVISRANNQQKNRVLKKIECLIFLENARLAKLNCTTKTSAGSDDIEMHKHPPKAKYIFRHIFDDVFELPVADALGIDGDDPWFLRAGKFVPSYMYVHATRCANFLCRILGDRACMNLGCRYDVKGYYTPHKSKGEISTSIPTSGHVCLHTWNLLNLAHKQIYLVCLQLLFSNIASWLRSRI